MDGTLEFYLRYARRDAERLRKEAEHVLQLAGEVLADTVGSARLTGSPCPSHHSGQACLS